MGGRAGEGATVGGGGKRQEEWVGIGAGKK